jgi:hypothetical protein
MLGAAMLLKLADSKLNVPGGVTAVVSLSPPQAVMSIDAADAPLSGKSGILENNFKA